MKELLHEIFPKLKEDFPRVNTGHEELGMNFTKSQGPCRER